MRVCNTERTACAGTRTGGLAGRMSALHHALGMLASPVVDIREQIFTELGNEHYGTVRYLLLQSVYTTHKCCVCVSGMGDGEWTG